MAGYVISILGIVICGIVIDVLIPSGSVSKYIKGMYSIFVVAVIMSPLVKFLTQKNDFKFNYQDIKLDEELVCYIYEKRTNALELEIEQSLDNAGFSGIDIELQFSINNNEITYNKCLIDLKDLVILSDKQHINKYEFITKIVKDFTNLTDEEIVINE